MSKARPPARKGPTRKEFDRSVSASRKHADDLQLDLDLDAALIRAGRNIADTIDRALIEQDLVDEVVGEADEDIDIKHVVARAVKARLEVNKVMYLSPHLMNVLREIHGTPKARREARALPEPTTSEPEDVTGVGNQLSRLQGLRGGRSG